MKYLILSALIFGSNLFKENRIYYNPGAKSQSQISYLENTKLTWKDFKKRPQKNKEAALSCTGIVLNTFFNNGHYDIEVNCTFDKNMSYFVSGQNTAYVLNHEQGHFDITFYFSKLLINRLKNEKNLDENKISYIYDKILIEWDAFQQEYDKQTDHSLIVQKQSEWDLLIQEKLLTIKN
jgi:hypothetical protein